MPALPLRFEWLWPWPRCPSSSYGFARDPGHTSPPLGRVRSCLTGALCRLLAGPYPCPGTPRRQSHVWGGPDGCSRKESMAWTCFTEGLPSPSRGNRPSAQQGSGRRTPPGLLTRGHPQGDKETGSRPQSGTAACPQAAPTRDSPRWTRASHRPLLSFWFLKL